MEIYRKFEQDAQALRCALQLNNMHLIKEIFYGCKEQSTQKQLAFLLARQQVFINLDDAVSDAQELDNAAHALREENRQPELGERGMREDLVPLVSALDHAHVNDLKDILYNAQLSRNFLALAKEARRTSRATLPSYTLCSLFVALYCSGLMFCRSRPLC